MIQHIQSHGQGAPESSIKYYPRPSRSNTSYRSTQSYIGSTTLKFCLATDLTPLFAVFVRPANLDRRRARRTGLPGGSSKALPFLHPRPHTHLEARRRLRRLLASPFGVDYGAIALDFDVVGAAQFFACRWICDALTGNDWCCGNGFGVCAGAGVRAGFAVEEAGSF